MKKFLSLVLFVLLGVCPALAEQDYSVPIPAEDDEVTLSGPNTKLSELTQMRYEAFQNAEITVDADFPEERKNIEFYKLSENGKYVHRVKIPNAKIYEYTNGFFDVIFKDTKDKIFNYDNHGRLIGFAVVTNNGKVPFVTYHYNTNGQIKQVEVKPRNGRSYVYGIEGLLVEYNIDDKTYDNCGKLIKRKKSILY